MGYSQEGYDAEIMALNILEEKGYEIIYSPEKSKREIESKYPSRDEWIKLEKKLEKLGYSTDYIKKTKTIRTEIDKEHLIKSKNVKLTQSQKNNLLILINQWNKWNKQHKELNDHNKQIRILLTKIIGKSVIPKSVKENHKQRIKKEKEPRWKEFFIKTFKISSQHTFVDIFCKKSKTYYIFDVKHKTFKDNKNLNRFYVTNYEVLNYVKIIKENKVKLKILIIVDKGKKSFYKIFDWKDFHIPKSFDPHKNMKTSIRLKTGLDLNEFKEWNKNS